MAIDTDVAIAVAAGPGHTLLATRRELYSTGDNRQGGCRMIRPFTRSKISVCFYAHITDVYLSSLYTPIHLLLTCMSTHAHDQTRTNSLARICTRLGQLGLGDTQERLELTRVSLPAVASSLAAGMHHSVVATVEGTVFVFGSNQYGQLGLESEEEGSAEQSVVATPRHIVTLARHFVVQVAAGLHYSVALTIAREVLVWGLNDVGQLGLGHLSNRPSPVLLEGIGAVVSIACGLSHTMIVMANGSVWGTGSNDAGQLGLGDRRDRETFARVKFSPTTVCDTLEPTNLPDSFVSFVCVGGPDRPISMSAVTVAAGDSHTLAIAQDGNIWGWGLNSHGQLGVSNLGHGKLVSSVPLPLATLFSANASSVAGGSQHTIIRTDFQKAVIHEVLPRMGPASQIAVTRIWWLGVGFNSLRSHALRCVFTGSSVLETTASIFSNFRAFCLSPSAAAGSNWTEETIQNVSGGTIRNPLYSISLYSIGVAPTDPASSQPRQPVSEMTGRTVEANNNFTFHLLEECSDPDCARYCLKDRPKCFPGIVKSIPMSGPRDGGTTVTVVGYGFLSEIASDVRCRFGDHRRGTQQGGKGHILNATHLTCESTSAVEVDSLSTSDGDWIVQLRVTLNGQDYSATASPFFYYRNPRLTHTSAPSVIAADARWLSRPEFSYGGPLTGGTILEVHGRDSLEAARLQEAKCSFAGVTVAATLVSTYRVRCVSPAFPPSSAAYDVPVSVMLNGVSELPQEASHRVSFIAYLSPSIHAIEPNTVPSHVPVVIRLQGANLRIFSWFPRYDLHSACLHMTSFAMQALLPLICESACVYTRAVLHVHRCVFGTMQTAAHVLNDSLVICSTPLINASESFAFRYLPNAQDAAIEASLGTASNTSRPCNLNCTNMTRGRRLLVETTATSVFDANMSASTSTSTHAVSSTPTPDALEANVTTSTPATTQAVSKTPDPNNQNVTTGWPSTTASPKVQNWTSGSTTGTPQPWAFTQNHTAHHSKVNYTNSSAAVEMTTTPGPISSRPDSAWSISFFPHPQVIGLSVYGGPMKGGTELDIFGRGFNVSVGTKVAVRFHCRRDLAASFPELLIQGRVLSPFYNLMDAPVSNPNVVRATVLSASQLRCITPTVSCQGAFDVSVALNGYDFHSDAPAPAGSAPLRFEFYPSPVLHDMQPLGGPITGNTTVIVSGRGLKAYNESLLCRFGPETDEFGNVTGASLDTESITGKALSDDRFVCQSPSVEKPMLVMLSVSLNGVDFERVGLVPFTFYRTPSVSLLSPAGGPSVGGTRVDVRGQGFLAFPLGGKLMCRFGRTAVPSSNWTTNFKSMCIAPKNLAGTAVVTFSLNGQDYGSRVFFHYYDLPTITHSTPRGGEPSRTPEESTSVHVHGKGFLRFHGRPLCKFGCALSPALVQDDQNLLCSAPWPVDNYQLFLNDCSPRERILECDTSACTLDGCVPLLTHQVLNISCVLDTWLEVSLNGVDFTSDSNVNYRYFHQPQFLKFGPSGGPRTGNTLVEIFSGPLGGFQRLNDGSVTLVIGGRPVVCESEPGEIVLEDDFDPIPLELKPSSEQMKMILNYSADFEDVRDQNFEAYIVDKHYWQTGEGLTSDKICGGIAQSALISAIIDAGNEQGFGAKLVNFTDLSAALRFTGKTSDVLLGRHALSRSIDISRGAFIEFSVRRGEEKWPNPCEAPEAGDDLLLLMRTEAYTNGVEVPAWYERDLWHEVNTFGALDPELAGSIFVPFQKRINASRHILGTRKPVQNMIDCKRDQPCNTSQAKILLLQPNHGSGPYDVWAVDNLNVIANGGVISDSRIVCRSPPTDVLGPASVSLALNGQQFSEAGAGNPAGQEKFIYYDEPVIESILPSGGPDGGQTVITIVGSGFKNFKDENYPPRCKFGIQTTDAIIKSDSEVVCPGVRETVYTGFAKVFIALNGVDFTAGPLVYVYYQQPRLYSLYPNSGPSRGGTEFNIIGEGFIYLTPFPSSYQLKQKFERNFDSKKVNLLSSLLICYMFAGASSQTYTTLKASQSCRHAT